jgi:RND family efflux transporter MFP subunit
MCLYLLPRNNRLNVAFYVTCLFFITINPSFADDLSLVAVERVSQSNTDNYTVLTGTIASSKVARISSQISGQVKSIEIAEGDYLNKGDVILFLDDEIQKLTLSAAKADTKQAKAALADSKRRFENAKQLIEQEIISENDFDLLNAEVEIDTSALQRQIEEERRQRALLDRYSVTAPFSGIISEKFTEVGEWITPGVPIVRLVNLDDLRAEFRVSQNLFTDVYEKQRVLMSVDAHPDIEFEGFIHAIIPENDINARTFLAYVPIDAKTTNTIPGMSVRGKINLRQKDSIITVSRDALVRRPDGSTRIWIAREKDGQYIVSEQIVETGQSFGNQVTIVTGLKVGDQIVVRGNESLRDGEIVSVTNK